MHSILPPQEQATNSTVNDEYEAFATKKEPFCGRSVRTEKRQQVHRFSSSLIPAPPPHAQGRRREATGVGVSGLVLVTNCFLFLSGGIPVCKPGVNIN
mmetsp:Transcript_10518/g.25685  ORF Transcript_10518/g.25685 Transcript_10518/m.25685 type:complete len:98 (+) Transcript_10518:1666-1959(+)